MEEAYLQKFLQKFQHLKIQLKDIKNATNNFDSKTNQIGVGGFGNVYKGEVSHYEGQSMVAIKRLDRTHGQGTSEFLKEITTLSDYKHENVISLLGFCCEGGEMVLVYQLAFRGSLDRYLNSPDLTWSQRLKICLDAAKGLCYLHDPRETHRRLIHCDIKSSNILLDDQWNAKVSDLGLSIIGSANEQHSVVVTPAAGTLGYIDPLYRMTNTLTKESDVYSFGVVLFEVLCGRLCYTHSNGRVQQLLVPSWTKSYEHNQLNDIIFRNPAVQPIHQDSLKSFSSIAYRCLRDSREDRPTMAEVVKELGRALKSQDRYILEYQELLKNHEIMREWIKQCSYHEKIMKTAEPPLSNRSEVELTKLLSKGVLLNHRKTWFTLNKKGEHCEMISIAECIRPYEMWWPFISGYNSRFVVGTCWYNADADKILKTHVKAQFLTPGITYTVNLVFKFMYTEYKRRCEPLFLKYTLEGESKKSISHMAYEREDGWWMCELYQFTIYQKKTVDLEIFFDGFSYPSSSTSSSIQVEGIGFWPMEKVEHEDDNQPVSDSSSDSDATWEEKMPTDYEDIMKSRSDNNMQWITMEEAYSIIRKGFLIIDDKTNKRIWFSLDKNGKKCHMLSSALIWWWDIGGNEKSKLILPESRFGEAVQCDSKNIHIKTEVQSQLVSYETRYAIYLVYKLPKDQFGFEAPVKVKDTLCDSGDKVWYIYFVSPRTPVIGLDLYRNTHNPLSMPKIKGVPQQRNDGWMEVQIWELQTATTINMYLMLSPCDKKKFGGLIIEGIEFRPI